MSAWTRRSLLQLAGIQFAGLKFAAAAPPAPTRAAWPSSNAPIRLGVAVWVADGETPESIVARVRELSFSECQIGFRNLTPEAARPLKNALRKHGVRATALMELGPGKMIWDFYGGPKTIGLVPPGTRQARIRALKMAADVAEACDIPAIHTHCGFIPENPNDPVYLQAVAAVREVAAYAKQRGRIFLCETGQETPITLLRMIRDTGQDNLFVNLDLANLILYDKGNPVDAFDVIGPLVRGLHAKDGQFPTDPKALGNEVPIGQGKVNFPEVLKKLKVMDYQGPMTIEREIEGEQQRTDILSSKAYLANLMAQIYA